MKYAAPMLLAALMAMGCEQQTESIEAAREDVQEAEAQLQETRQEARQDVVEAREGAQEDVQQAREGAQEEVQEARQDVQQAEQELMQARQQLEQRIQQLRNELAALEAQAGVDGMDPNEQKRINELQTHFATVEGRVQNLQAGGEQGVNEALDDLEKQINETRDQLDVDGENEMGGAGNL